MSETAIRDGAPGPQEPPSGATPQRKPGKHSTAQYRMDVDRAEILAHHFPSLS